MLAAIASSFSWPEILLHIYIWRYHMFMIASLF